MHNKDNDKQQQESVKHKNESHAAVIDRQQWIARALAAAAKHQRAGQDRES